MHEKSDGRGNAEERAVRLDRLLLALADEIAAIRRREISIADRVSEKVTASGSDWLGDGDFLVALQDFDLMSQELDHVSSMLTVIAESLQRRDTVAFAVDHGVDAVKLSSMQARLRKAIYGDAVEEVAKADEEDELW